jgi:xanthine dehydrogenase accessory factor
MPIKPVSTSNLRRPDVLVRGGGDLATGVVWRLHRSGFRVLVTELDHPLTVRRTVSVSSAVREGKSIVESMTARRIETINPIDELSNVLSIDEVPVLVSPGLPDLDVDIVIDARLAKRNIDTSLSDGRFVVALGPGFDAGIDCDAVVETMRGHRLGRVLWKGSAIPNTGVPGEVGGKSTQRVLRAPSDGKIDWLVSIGDSVRADQAIGVMGNGEVLNASFAGVIRGLIHPDTSVRAGLKVGDIDPRSELFEGTRKAESNEVHTISDKALAIGGGVLEAILTWKSGRYRRRVT